MSALLRLVKRDAFQKARNSASNCLREVWLIAVIWKAYFFSTGTTFQIAIIGKCSERFWSITV